MTMAHDCKSINFTYSFAFLPSLSFLSRSFNSPTTHSISILLYSSLFYSLSIQEPYLIIHPVSLSSQQNRTMGNRANSWHFEGDLTVLVDYSYYAMLCLFTFNSAAIFFLHVLYYSVLYSVLLLLHFMYLFSLFLHLRFMLYQRKKVICIRKIFLSLK
jgi:hypothetical protein